MHPSLLPAGLSGLLLLCGCATASQPASPALPHLTSTGAALGGIAPVGTELAQAALGLYQVTLDPTTLSASLDLLALRTGAQNDDVTALSVADFLTADSLKLEGISETATTIDLSYTFTHPFAGPTSLTPPGNAANRADLGAVVQIVVLADVAPASPIYFPGDGDIQCATGLLANANGYLEPRGLLGLTGYSADAFPYQVLVDEALDNRVGISNSGDPLGNFDDAPGGWQVTNIVNGPTNNGWRGLGYLHQGQAATRTLSFNKSALTSPKTFTTAVLAKYAQPKVAKAQKLPPTPFDVEVFGYRAFHGALDCEDLQFHSETGGLIPNTLSTTTTTYFKLRDWDRQATETIESDLSLDADPTTVAVGESGAPAVEVSMPGVTTGVPVGTILDDDTGFNVVPDPEAESGLPGDEIVYSLNLVNAVTSGQVSGPVTGLVRATDPEAGIDTTSWLRGLDPFGGILTGNLPIPVVYQSFAVTLGVPSDPPSATYTITTPNVVTGGTVSLAIQSLFDTEGDDIDLLVDWDDDGTYTLAATQSTPYPGSIPLTSPITFTYSGSPPDNRDLPVRLSDGVNTVDLLPTQTFAVIPSGGPACSTGPWTSPTPFGAFWNTALETLTTPSAGQYGTAQCFGSFKVPTLGFPAPNTNAGWVYQVGLPNPTPTSFNITRMYANGPSTASGFSEIALTNAPTLLGSSLATARQVTEIDVDATNRVVFLLKSVGDYQTGLRGPNQHFPFATAAFHWFDTDGGSAPATDAQITAVPTAQPAHTLAIGAGGDVYIIDSTKTLRRYIKAATYAEDTVAPFPMNLAGAPFNIGATQTIHAMDISLYNGAFFVLTAEGSSSTGQERIYRIECDGTLPNPVLPSGNPNPDLIDIFNSAVFTAGDRRADLTIDNHSTTGTVLGGISDVEMVLSGYGNAAAPAFTVKLFTTQLGAQTASLNSTSPYRSAINTQNNWLMTVAGSAVVGKRIWGTPPVGWQ